MSVINSLEKRSITGALADSWYQPGGFFYGGAGTLTKSGTRVSELTAMQLSVVWGCVKIISEDCASLPLHLYRRLPNGGKERATDHPLYSLLHDSPNPEMTAFSFREALQSHVLTWGNGYAEIVRGRGILGRNTIRELWPITPNRVTVKRNDQKKLVYHISMAGTGLQDVVLPRENVLHIPGLSFNGLVGYSPIAAHREAIGMGMALNEYGQAYFGDGVNPSVVVSHPGQLKNPKSFRESLQETYGGLGKAHKLMLLEESMKIERLGIPNGDAQFLETRKYQNVDIGTRIYRLPPQMYGEYDKSSTYASAEQFSIDYVTKTLRSWLVRDEQTLNMMLLSKFERGDYFFEHLVDGLLRGDIQSRYAAYSIAKAARIMTTNEIRALENLNPIEGEDGLDVTPNMIPKDNAPKEPSNA